MAAWPHHNLRQKITYWAPGTPDGFGGRSYVAPASLTARWEDRVNLFVDNSGNESVSDAVVYLGSAVVVKGYLYNGVSTSTAPPDGAREIKRVDKTPTLNAQYALWKVFL